MNAKLRTPMTSSAVLVALLLTGCVVPMSPEEDAEVDEQIRAAIELEFPLPEQVTIRTHVGDDVRFSTGLPLDGVLAFYRDAYDGQRFLEQADSQVSADKATLRFAKDGEEKDVLLNVMNTETGSDVHIWLESP